MVKSSVHSWLIVIGMVIFHISVSAQMFSYKDDPFQNGYPTIPCNNLVKIVKTSEYEVSSGFIVGTDTSYLYVVSTNHSTAGDSEVNLFLNQTNNQYVKGTVISRSSDLDMCIVKLKRQDLSGITHQQKGLVTHLFPLIIAREKQCQRSDEITLSGYASGSYQSDRVKTTILGQSWYDDSRFLRIKTSSIEGGHSGSPVFNELGELIGITIEKNNEQTAAKILKLNQILDYLKENNIPSDALQYNQIIGRFSGEGAYMANKKPVSLTDSSDLILYNDGSCSGLINGTFCLIGDGSKIRFFSTEGELIGFENPSAQGFTSVTPFPGNLEFNIDVHWGFDFSGNGGGSSTLSLSNAHFSMSLNPVKRTIRE